MKTTNRSGKKSSSNYRSFGSKLGVDVYRAAKAFWKHLGELWQAILVLLHISHWEAPPINEIDEAYFTAYLTKNPVEIQILEIILPKKSRLLFWRESAKIQMAIAITIAHKVGLSFWKKLVFIVIPNRRHPEKNIHFVAKEVSKKQLAHGRWKHILILKPENLIANSNSQRFITDPKNPVAIMTMKINKPAIVEVKSLTFEFAPYHRPNNKPKRALS